MALALYVAQVDSARLHLAPREGDALRALLDRAAATLEAARRAALDGAPGGRGREVQADVRLDGDPFEGEVGRLARARRIAAGVVVDATTTQLRVAPGESLAVTATLWNTGPAPAPAGFCLGGTRSSWNLFPDSAPRLPLNLSSRRGSCAVVDAAGRLSAEPRDAGMLAPGRLLTARLEGTLPAAEDYTTPYFLRAPRQGDLYTWVPDQRLAWGEPFGEPRWWITPIAPMRRRMSDDSSSSSSRFVAPSGSRASICRAAIRAAGDEFTAQSYAAKSCLATCRPAATGERARASRSRP